MIAAPTHIAFTYVEHVCLAILIKLLRIGHVKNNIAILVTIVDYTVTVTPRYQMAPSCASEYYDAILYRNNRDSYSSRIYVKYYGLTTRQQRRVTNAVAMLQQLSSKCSVDFPYKVQALRYLRFMFD